MKNITAILLIVLSIGMFFVFVDPMYSDIQTKLEKKAAYDDALNNSHKVLGIRDELLNKYNNFLPTDLSRLEKLLPDQINNIRLIIEIDSIASKYNMALKDVKLNVTEDPAQAADQMLEVVTKPYGVGSLSFKVFGSYGAFREFVKDLEKSLRIIDVASVEFKASDSGGKFASDFYDFSMIVDTYWLKQ